MIRLGFNNFFLPRLIGLNNRFKYSYILKHSQNWFRIMFKSLYSRKARVFYDFETCVKHVKRKKIIHFNSDYPPPSSLELRKPQQRMPKIKKYSWISLHSKKTRYNLSKWKLLKSVRKRYYDTKENHFYSGKFNKKKYVIMRKFDKPKYVRRIRRKWGFRGWYKTRMNKFIFIKFKKVRKIKKPYFFRFF